MMVLDNHKIFAKSKDAIVVVLDKFTVKNVMKFTICLLYSVVWKLKLGLAKENLYISHWKLSNLILNFIYAYWSKYYWYWKLQH